MPETEIAFLCTFAVYFQIKNASMIRAVGLLFFAALFAMACSMRRGGDPVLREVRQVLDRQPDSALLILEGIDSRSMTPRSQAGYSLLLVEALDMNELSLLAADSLLDVALGYLREEKDTKRTAEALLYKGRVWDEKRAYERAVGAYLEAANLLLPGEDDRPTLSKIYDDLGQVYLKQNLPAKALEMFRKGYDLDHEMADPTGLTVSLRNIGRTHLTMHRPDSALHYLHQACRLAGQTADSIHFRDLIYADLSASYDAMGEYETALRYLKKIVYPRPNIPVDDRYIRLKNYYKNHAETAAAQLKNENKRRINILLYAFAALCAIAFGMFILRRKKSAAPQENIDELQCEIFRKTPTWKHIIHPSESGTKKAVISPEEREKLRNETAIIFARFIEKLRTSCPTLTDDEILHCCLALAGMDAKAISLCFGYTSTSATRQRKTRIKKKMTHDSPSTPLYHSIFTD
jgi:tetratricopeptide (TPR) repeat protein